jgi:hypothetical protein
MRRSFYLGGLTLAVLLIGLVAWRIYAVTPPMPHPEDGTVASGSYRSEYFDLTYPLPPGWTEGETGPDPSESGYYVLSTVLPKDELTGTILIAAQDMFFTAKAHSTAEMAAEFRQSISAVEGMTIDREPSEVRIAGRLLQRVDFSGVGLYRAMFATEIRCHIVSFHFTARDPELLERLALSLNDLSATSEKWTSPSVPTCIKDYAVEDNLLHRVAPMPVGSKFSFIPVRIIVGTDGGVKHVHVIRAEPVQRQSIEDALRQWRFKPYQIGGRAVEIETGLTFRFKSAGM